MASDTQKYHTLTMARQLLCVNVDTLVCKGCNTKLYYHIIDSQRLLKELIELVDK